MALNLHSTSLSSHESLMWSNFSLQVNIYLMVLLGSTMDRDSLDYEGVMLSADRALEIVETSSYTESFLALSSSWSYLMIGGWY